MPLAIISRIVRRSSSVMPGSTAGGASTMFVSGWPAGPIGDPAHLPSADVEADLEAEEVAVEGQRSLGVVVGEGSWSEW